MSRRAVSPWVWYGAIVVLTFVPLVWLTQKVVQLDDAQRLALQRFDEQERVGRALWRMDVKLMPLLVEEANWSEEEFQPLVQGAVTGGGKGVTTQQLSPLLRNSVPPHVLLYFEQESGQALRSPWVPLGNARDVVLRAKVPIDQMELAQDRLDELGKDLDAENLLAKLPEVSEVDGINGVVMIPGQEGNALLTNPSIVANAYGVPTENLTQLGNGLSQVPGSETDNFQNSASGIVNNSRAPQLAENNSRAGQLGASARRSRGSGNDLDLRNGAYQNFAQQKVVGEKRFGDEAIAKGAARSGPWQPLWSGDRLLMARRVRQGERCWVQGIWLNWDYLKTVLVEEVADLELPVFELVPAKELSAISQPHLLATLPVEVLVEKSAGLRGGWNSALRWSLVVAWLGVAAAALAAGIVLQGVTALSERRAAFVSAVTHELRTPLTTFRMYAEMLAENMVSSEDQRQAYAKTLKTEADRLAHLVENVLEYAQLERGKSRSRRETIRLAPLLERIAPRLQERAESAGMGITLRWDNEGDREALLSTDPVAVEQILFNLVDNSCKYGKNESRAEIEIAVGRSKLCNAVQGSMGISVRDFGEGISKSQQRRLFQPFSKSAEEAASSAPGVGLGLALCKRVAVALGGKLELVHTGNEGTEFMLCLPLQ